MSALDAVFSMRVFADGTEMVSRKKVNFIGPTIADDPAQERLDITIPSVADLATKANKKLTYVTVPNTTKTLSQSDEATVQECTNNSAVTITAPSLEAGTIIVLSQIGSGKVSVVASGVTLQFETGYTAATRNQFVDIILRWRDSTHVQITGALST